MENINKILLLAGNTYRSNLYIQFLSNFSFDFEVLLYGFGEEKILPDFDFSSKSFFKEKGFFIPKTGIGIKHLLEELKIENYFVDHLNINSFSILDKINKIQPDLVIFSGYGGDILGPDYFKSQVKYLHMHPGDIPHEKGSTTIYFSILNKGYCTVSSFFMNEKIDSGEIILKSNYEKPTSNVDIDIFYDNMIRSDHLIRTLNNISQRKDSIDLTDSYLEYFIIHPVLKHISILSLK